MAWRRSRGVRIPSAPLCLRAVLRFRLGGGGRSRERYRHRAVRGRDTTAPTRLLRAIHSFVGAPLELVAPFDPVPLRKPNAARVTAEQRGPQTVGHLHGSIDGAPRQNGRKLISAIPCQDVVAAELLGP